MENNTNSSLPDSCRPVSFWKKKIILTRGDKVRLLIGFFTLLPIRLILLVFSFLVVWCSSSIGLLGMDEDKPASGFRRRLQDFNYFVARFTFRFCFGFISPKITGDILPAEEAPILVVAPHTSVFDFWVVCWFGNGSGLVRDENKNTPFMGTILRFHQMVFVKRSSKDSRQEALHAITERTSNKKWGRLLIFPEGTTSVGASLLPFKKGAFLPGPHLIHPIIVRYPNKLDCTTWTVGNGVVFTVLEMFFKAMASLYNKAELEVMPAVQPAGDPTIFGENLRRRMVEKMGMALFEGDLTHAESLFE